MPFDEKLLDMLNVQLEMTNRSETGRDADVEGSDHEDDQSETSVSIGSSENTAKRPRLIHLVKSSMPLIKLFRILRNKLLNTPTGKPPFTFGPSITSAEINSIDDELEKLNHSTENLSTAIGSIQIAISAEIDRESACYNCGESFDSCVWFLLFYRESTENRLLSSCDETGLANKKRQMIQLTGRSSKFLQTKSGRLHRYILDLSEAIRASCEMDNMIHHLRIIERSIRRISKHFYAFFALLCFYLIPSTTHFDHCDMSRSLFQK
ncbi:hypothetical protein KEM48_008280 [Puccinia striiformis f. sp. tritici PST-130]|nr:hypothetical protein KEM48_008280 [Puccinia striiformis f. sp. tritici PST-130]